VGVGLFVGVGDLVGVGLLVGVGDLVGVGFFVGVGLLLVGDGGDGVVEAGPDADGPGDVGSGGEAATVVVLLLGEGGLGATERDELGEFRWTAVSTAAFGRWPHFAAGASAALAGVLTAKMPKTPADSTVAPASAPRPAPRRVVNTISASSRSASRQGFPRHL
jgi:hypothetical protein